ncbi:MAG: nickel pincer cofactor biosynthesis protein LarB [Candidatus Nitrosocaldus sp.]|nr:nickel pincer cofactor biosynthesis protein LarB [Candidatus Nitrosocaldus sp.]
MSIRDILKALADGRIGIDDAEQMLRLHNIEYVEDMARLDINRELRRGIPEIVYAEGKEYSDLVKIALTALRSKDTLVISRVKQEYMDMLVEALSKHATVKSSKRGRIVVARRMGGESLHTSALHSSGGVVGVITAGTSDIGVAEEARLVAEAMGCKVIASYDVGVAGLHRLFPVLKDMIASEVDAMVVVAGMEGALPSVVASLVDVPVIGVPTSVGYGFGAGGVAALTSMLQSCTLGLAVVNIDNGVGAGVLASMIAKRVGRYRSEQEADRGAGSKDMVEGLAERIDGHA